MTLQDLPKFKFRNDSYTRARGAPAMLMIVCAGCGQYVISYQKDGPGPLMRCYLDRIHHPEDIKQRQHGNFSKNECPKLECPQCHALIGVPTVYEKENRLAYTMRPGFFSIKRLYQGKKLKEPKAAL